MWIMISFTTSTFSLSSLSLCYCFKRIYSFNNLLKIEHNELNNKNKQRWGSNILVQTIPCFPTVQVPSEGFLETWALNSEGFFSSNVICYILIFHIK